MARTCGMGHHSNLTSPDLGCMNYRHISHNMILIIWFYFYFFNEEVIVK
uniref:Uncharacterized protein n=1 Tax=Arundo donax TaxID=35708 RepID=A0A0A9HSZ5_ARUDO